MGYISRKKGRYTIDIYYLFYVEQVEQVYIIPLVERLERVPPYVEHKWNRGNKKMHGVNHTVRKNIRMGKVRSFAPCSRCSLSRVTHTEHLHRQHVFLLCVCYLYRAQLFHCH